MILISGKTSKTKTNIIFLTIKLISKFHLNNPRNYYQDPNFKYQPQVGGSNVEVDPSTMNLKEGMK